ncbi:hypothetical protein HPB48_009417 [Haemaphysalis longicornis]|uniref:Uncharacterized protein n=1 Tax=Haemaphysalis longicornis TaxID=44386 RepID=A0A9J6GHA4_HAELO|nr:hypothetical protein HPB48_009417 [Haemaphysalis longicornis]
MSSETDSRWQTVYHYRRRSQDLATIIIRLLGIPLAKSKPNELMQALAAAARLTQSEITNSIFQRRPQQNLIAVKTFRPSAQQKFLVIRSFLLASTEVPVTTYEASPAGSCRGVIHGVPAGTSPHELLSHLISTATSIIEARMMGSTETAPMTFGGSLVPAMSCTIRPNTDATKNAPMPHLNQNLTNLTPGQEHDCYATSRNCKGSHPSTWTECPEELKADAEHRKTTVIDPGLIIAIQAPRPQSTINDKIRSTTRPSLPNAKT